MFSENQIAASDVEVAESMDTQTHTDKHTHTHTHCNSSILPPCFKEGNRLQIGEWVAQLLY
jgi:hypothetical protein